MPSDGSIIIDTRIDTKSARADLQMLEAKAKSTTQEIGALDKSMEKAGKQKIRAGEDLDNARAAADATAKALEEVNARLEKAQAEARAAVRQEYSSMSQAAVNDIALSRTQGANPELFSQSDQLAQKLDQQESKAADLEAEYQKQVAAVEKLDALHAQLVERLKQEQAAAQAQAEAVQKAEAAQQRARQMQAGDDAMQRYFAKMEAQTAAKADRQTASVMKRLGISDSEPGYVSRAEQAVKGTQEAAKQDKTSVEALNRNTDAVNNLTGRLQPERETGGKQGGKGGRTEQEDGDRSAAKRVGNASKAMQQFGSRIKEIASGALLFNLISSGLSTVVSWFGTALQSTNAFRQALANLQGAASVAAAPLVDALGNALAYVINLLATGMSYLARFISMLTGKSLSAMKNSAKAMNSYGSAAGSAAKETEKATRSLAGFDEITRLDAPQEDSPSGGGGGAASPDYGFVDETGAGFSKLLDILKGFWNTFTQALGPSIAAWSAAWNKIKDTALAVWPGIQTAALGLWTNGLQPLLTYTAGTWAPGILNAFSEAFAPIVGDLISARIQIFADAFVWACGIVTDAIRTLLMPAMQVILTIWQQAMAGIQQAWAQYGQPIVDGAVEAFRNIETVLSTFYYTVVQPILADLIARVQQLWDQHLKKLWDDTLAMIGAWTNALLTFWNNILLPLINWVVQTFGPYFVEAFNAVAQGVQTAVGLISDVIDLSVFVLKNLMDFVTNVFQGNWNGAWNAMGNLVSGVWQRIQDTVRGAVNGIIGYVNSMISAIVAGVNGIVDAVNAISIDIPNWDWLPDGIAGTHIGFSLGHVTAPQIPYLAQGAVIPPNREFMAVLGDQSHGTNVEAPLATIQQAVAAVMQDNLDGELAALEAIRATLLDILQAVYGIDISDTKIGKAANRYTTKQAIITGRA